MNPGVFCDNKDYLLLYFMEIAKTTPDISCMFFLNDYKCIISLVIMNEMQHSVFLLCLTEHEILKVLMDVDKEKK